MTLCIGQGLILAGIIYMYNLSFVIFQFHVKAVDIGITNKCARCALVAYCEVRREGRVHRQL